MPFSRRGSQYCKKSLMLIKTNPPASNLVISLLENFLERIAPICAPMTAPRLKEMIRPANGASVPSTIRLASAEMVDMVTTKCDVAVAICTGKDKIWVIIGTCMMPPPIPKRPPTIPIAKDSASPSGRLKEKSSASFWPSFCSVRSSYEKDGCGEENSAEGYLE